MLFDYSDFLLIPIMHDGLHYWYSRDVRNCSKGDALISPRKKESQTIYLELHYKRAGTDVKNIDSCFEFKAYI